MFLLAFCYRPSVSAGEIPQTVKELFAYSVNNKSEEIKT